MPYQPQQYAGVLSFYDTDTKGPKIDPKIVIVFGFIFALAILLISKLV
ncbi:MAG: preprotein translocase subunit Sec61beta [Candidatus Micrarchaeia archaeon]|jgi:preprotein translocase subunit Sec61beta